MGQGGIQKRVKNGRVRWVARFRGPDGRERSRTFDRKVDAEQWRAEQLTARGHGTWIDPARGRITFGDWTDEWLSHQHDLRPTSRSLTDGVVRNHLKPAFGGVSLSRLDSVTIRDYVASRVIEGASPSTIERHVQILRKILGDAVRDRRIGVNPVDGVRLPPRDERPMRMLTYAQVLELVETTRAYYRPLVLTAALTGLRWGELAGLQLDRLELLRRTVRVDQQLIEVSGKLTFGPPKTKAGIRTITLPETVVDVIAAHLRNPVCADSGLVFPGPTGKPLRRSNFRRRTWSTAVKIFADTPLEGFRFHELRHTAASLAIAAGAHPVTIRDRLGHSKISVTMDRYGHLFEGHDRKLADALDAGYRAAAKSKTADGQSRAS